MDGRVAAAFQLSTSSQQLLARSHPPVDISSSWWHDVHFGGPISRSRLNRSTEENARQQWTDLHDILRNHVQNEAPLIFHLDANDSIQSDSVGPLGAQKQDRRRSFPSFSFVLRLVPSVTSGPVWSRHLSRMRVLSSTWRWVPSHVHHRPASGSASLPVSNSSSSFSTDAYP